MNLDDIRPTPGKTRVYLKSLQVYPKYLDASDQRMPRTTPYRLLPGPVRYSRRATPAQVRAPYHVLPLCVPQGGCGEAAGAACRWQCGRCGCDVFCFKIVAVLGMHFCDPNQLIATKQRNKLAAANKALCYLTRGSFKEDQHTQASRLHRHAFD